MRFRTSHTTRFTYDLPASESHNQLRLKPLTCDHQKLLQFRLRSIPPASVLEYEDSYGNTVHSLSVYPPHNELVLTVDCLVDRNPGNGQRSFRRVRFSEYLTDDDARSLEQYDFLHESSYVPFGQPLRKFFWASKPEPREDVGEYVNRIVAYIRDQFSYEKGTTNVNSNLDHILSAGVGVCQDFAHLTIGVLRLAGVPARYVSGYLAPDTLKRKEPVSEQASHAWIEALLPDEGWIGFDPTHRGRITERHIRIAVGRDYGDVPPLRGVYRSAGKRQLMSVEL